MPVRDYPEYKVLVVDDHLLTRMLLQQQLRVIGFTQIDHATDGAEGLRMMEEHYYDIAIVDWMMPVMDGLSFIKSCTKDEKFSRCGFIVLSSESEKAMVENVLKSGASAYLTKPASKEDLHKTIDTVIDSLENEMG